jgi:hypothetical protein
MGHLQKLVYFITLFLVSTITIPVQYMTSDEQLVFRYDNTGHHKKQKLSTYPHHKHAGNRDNVIESTAPDLAAVLKEIEPLITLS